ncbi:hypothetical protein HELRODRAFT_98091 [Helobdella robusta]|uniref:TGF-beta family profile domain-containing protein n=1 Tax=Helobdella robusta TaxID=6412 RepID=T1G9K5_HELRO|nr:hypothetical protein HELRODRAFT_98091 [Helobdella robusta]ESO07906.1 hypothetical protein HELRODRAFT_98091 [Helobdella robusta]
MTELYKHVAYEDGVTKAPTPFEADIVRGLVDKASNSQSNYLFDLSHLKEKQENILESELHLFKLRPTMKLHGFVILFFIHFQLKLYQILCKKTSTRHPNFNRNPIDLRLLETRSILRSFKPGWETFKVKDVVKKWIDHPSSNHGFYVVATTPHGEELDADWIRFAQRQDHHGSKQPVLVIYNNNKDNKIYNKNINKSDKIHNNSDNNRINYNKRGRKVVERERKKYCQLYDMHVNFKDIGWSDWVIQPTVYNAYQCKGICPFPLDTSYHPTKHATVQSLVHALGTDNIQPRRLRAGSPCCVPSPLYSLSMLYNKNDVIILKFYDEMIAAGCACH